MGTVTDEVKEVEVKIPLGERIKSTLNPSTPALQSIAIVLIARLAGVDPWLLPGAALIIYLPSLTTWTINIRRR